MRTKRHERYPQQAEFFEAHLLLLKPESMQSKKQQDALRKLHMALWQVDRGVEAASRNWDEGLRRVTGIDRTPGGSMWTYVDAWLICVPTLSDRAVIEKVEWTFQKSVNTTDLLNHRRQMRDKPSMTRIEAEHFIENMERMRHIEAQPTFESGDLHGQEQQPRDDSGEGLASDPLAP